VERGLCVPAFDRTAFFLSSAIIALVVLLALHFGWLNDDALNYLTLADHLTQHQGFSLRPSWGDHYWAVFPGGYPLVIASLKLILSCTAFTASKIANGFFLIGSILIAARWLGIPLLIAAALFLSADMLEIASYSWSENAFIFAQIASLAALMSYLESGKSTALFSYVAALLLAISSRYIGGFMLAGYVLLQAWFFTINAYRRQRLTATLAITFTGAVLFALYLYANIRLTGYPTGMARLPAQESLLTLALQFITQLFFSLWLLVPPLLLLFLGGARPSRVHIRNHPKALPPLLFGLFYLGLLFILRSYSYFEPFSSRLLTPGTVLVYLGLLRVACEAWLPQKPKIAKWHYTVFLAAAFLNLTIAYQDLLKHPLWIAESSMEKAEQRFHTCYDPLPDGSVLIAAGVGYNDPTVSWNVISPIFSSDRIFYALIDNEEMTEQAFRVYLLHLRYKEKKPTGYWFDFSGFANAQALHTALAQSPVNPALAVWIESHFKPRSIVPCHECSS